MSQICLLVGWLANVLIELQSLVTLGKPTLVYFVHCITMATQGISMAMSVVAQSRLCTSYLAFDSMSWHMFH